jgi:nuclear pore complex protein Nup98-Nup96
MFGQSAFGSTAPAFGAASTAPAFGAAGTNTGGMFGQAGGGAFGAQKPAFGAGTTFGGTTGETFSL